MWRSRPFNSSKEILLFHFGRFGCGGSKDDWRGFKYKFYKKVIWGPVTGFTIEAYWPVIIGPQSLAVWDSPTKDTQYDPDPLAGPPAFGLDLMA